jgi:hypothetical protein
MIVLYARKCSKSAKLFAEAIGARAVDVFKEVFDYGGDEDVICYGVNDPHLDVANYKGKVYNKPASVRNSVNKILTYRLLKAFDVPTCEFVLSENHIPDHWHRVVSRQTATGRNCEGVLISDPNDIIGGCPLYTNFFYHTAEYRIVMWGQQVVARYHKKPRKDGLTMDLVLMLPQGFEVVDETCRRAMKAMDLDIAGIDVVVDEDTQDFIILETNTGPLFTAEMEEFFKKNGV